MSDLFEMPEKKSNATEFTVSEISGALKRTVEETFSYVRVRGEISGYRGAHSSGHAYFALKDDKARLEAVIWRGVMSKLRFKPEEGMEVVVTGKLTTYPGSSKYQIVIEALEPAGAGALMALLDERRKKLAAEGLFDDAHKQALPFMPRVIGVVTSPTGAVIRDIIHRISDRFPLHILVWPVRVQGETSGKEVADAIIGFNALPPSGAVPRPDLIIVARGGGSLEDLWGFNDEAVVRAVAQSNLPIISAVGHETDWTLIDYVADRRAPTPTGAAEMAVPVRAELEAFLASLNARLKSALSRSFDFRRQRLSSAGRALPSADQLLALPRRRFDEAANRLTRALETGIMQKRTRFEGFGRRIAPPIILRTLNIKKRELSLIARRLQPEMIIRACTGGKEHIRILRHRLDTAFVNITEKQQRRLGELLRLAKSLSHESILERGFALVLDNKKKPVKRAGAILPGEALILHFIDGDIAAHAGDKTPPTSPPPKKTPAKKPVTKIGKTDNTDTQGSLF